MKRNDFRVDANERKFHSYIVRTFRIDQLDEGKFACSTRRLCIQLISSLAEEKKENKCFWYVRWVVGSERIKLAKEMLLTPHRRYRPI